MSDIEKEFFEAFGISKVQRCSLDSNNCPFGFSHKCSECDVDDMKVYPPITSDIVLGLEEMILNKLDTIQYTKKGDNHYYVECNEYVETYGTFGKTRKGSLLNLCIQLKSEIYEEVKAKALFKC